MRLFRNVFLSATFFCTIALGVFYVIAIPNRFLAIVFGIVTPLAFCIPLFLRKFLRPYAHEDFFNIFDILACAIFFITTPGNVYLYGHPGAEYDTLAHVLITGVVVIMVAMLFRVGRMALYRAPTSRRGAVIFSVMILVLLWVVWEAFQKFGDIAWGTHMFYDTDQPILRDLTLDLVADAVGTILGSMILWHFWDRWSRKWQGVSS